MYSIKGKTLGDYKPSELRQPSSCLHGIKTIMTNYPIFKGPKQTVMMTLSRCNTYNKMSFAELTGSDKTAKETFNLYLA